MSPHPSSRASTPEGGVRLPASTPSPSSAATGVPSGASTERLTQRIAELEARTAQLEARTAQLQKENSALNASQATLIDGFASYSVEQGERHTAKQHALEEDLRNMTNLAQARAGLPPLNTERARDISLAFDDVSDDENPRYSTRHSSRNKQLSHDMPAHSLSDLPSPPQMPTRSDFPESKKRKASHMKSSRASETDAHSGVEFPICINCYEYGLRCDAGLQCAQCKEHNVPCERAVCKTYPAGKCEVLNCTRAHKGDEQRFPGRLVRAEHVSKKKGGSGGAQNGGGDSNGKKRVRRGKRGSARGQME